MHHPRSVPLRAEGTLLAIALHQSLPLLPMPAQCCPANQEPRLWSCRNTLKRQMMFMHIQDELRIAMLGLCSLSVLHTQQQSQPAYERTQRRWFGLRPGRLIAVEQQTQQQHAVQSEQQNAVQSEPSHYTDAWKQTHVYR